MAPKVKNKTSGDEVARRIDHIIGMMRTLEWDRGRSAIGLAAEWKYTINTVEQYSAEASRAIRRELDPEALKETLGTAMLELVKHGKPIVQIKAADVAAKLAGVYAAQRLEVNVERMQFEALPPVEQAKRLREKAAECIQAAEEIERGLAIEVRELPQ